MTVRIHTFYRITQPVLAVAIVFVAASSLWCGETGIASNMQIEAEWLAQELSRLPQEEITESVDAQGGCDGIKSGRWGFHTGTEKNPWWQVDLGRSVEMDRIVVYNRCDKDVHSNSHNSNPAQNARSLQILVSDDNQKWEKIYQHDGSIFYGETTGKPLTVSPEDVSARYVRLQLLGNRSLHLDEIEIYGAGQSDKNLALAQPAIQSSTSHWSIRTQVAGREPDLDYPIQTVLERGKNLLDDIELTPSSRNKFQRRLGEIQYELESPSSSWTNKSRRALFMDARWTVREIAFSNPLLDFDDILFVKRAPGLYSHMSDQYYGWWSRPGGGVYILENFKSESPHLRCLTEAFPEGSFLRPDLSYDGKKLLFAYCRHFPDVSNIKNKVDKDSIPEDAFYSVYEMNVDGTGLRQLTSGRYDDFDARYLPNGEIVFLSTRRGQFVQCGKQSAAETLRADLPDSYVRCGGGNFRPVAVYTLHVIDGDGKNIRAISPFENFEWTPSIANDGRILYARWDYVDRDNMPFMSLWSCNYDGTNPRIVYGNFTWNPHSIFEARSIPDSSQLVFTASAHHSVTGGSLVLLDTNKAIDGEDPLTRLTPEIVFPESENWPQTFYANPYPLSERFFLTSWSDKPVISESKSGHTDGMSLNLFDVHGNLEPIYRDPNISSMCPIPVRPRKRPPVAPSQVDWDGPQEGRFLLADVYQGLNGVERGMVKYLRVIGMPAKTQPQMNSPRLGVTRDDPGKFVLGTVPVEPDGSAFFTVPSGVSLFFQALDEEGFAVQTMRTLTYVQPNQTLSCTGCHEPRHSAPPSGFPIASSRPPSKIVMGPEGSWPLRFDELVQPVLDRHCVGCHQPDGKKKKAAAFCLTGEKAYDNLVNYGKPSLRDHVLSRYYGGKSFTNQCAARESRLLAFLSKGHHDVVLDSDDLNRLVTWMDVYAQERGSFSEDQERRLLDLKNRMLDRVLIGFMRGSR